MRSLLLAKGGLNKVKAHHKELKQSDVEESIKSLSPGEWCSFTHPILPLAMIGFVNPIVDEKFVCIYLIAEVDAQKIPEFSVENFLRSVLMKAFNRRQYFNGYQKAARIFYGISDGLPGLIIDQFYDKAIIQINTAGIDRYRNLIKSTVESLISGEAFMLDNAKYREKELLPTYDTKPVPSLEIEENGLKFFIRSEVLQKVGFYYDHRENRYQLIQLMGRLNQKFEHATDLFCYAGAWGISALKAGVKKVSFVDQGDFENEINAGLELNGFEGRGLFFRSDVFKFLDAAISKKQTFDLILCDPPAFAKSLNQKDQALEGYSKLHRKVMKAASPGAVVAFSSCTHYVSHEEFQKNILDAANKENKKIQLLYSGIQGWDHPVASLMEKANYIKSYFYLMES